MKNVKWILFMGIVSFLISCHPKEKKEKYQLWYKQPATEWTEALPLGNGRLGAMVFSGVNQDHIQFNEETLWTGGPHSYAHKGAYKYLEQIRQLLREGKQKEAQDLATVHFMSQPLTQKTYQPFGDILIDFEHKGQATHYKRALSLNDATVRCAYEIEGVQYKRTAFISAPDQVLVYHLKASKASALNFSFTMDAVHQTKEVRVEGNSVILKVKVADSVMKGYAKLKCITDGTMTTEGATVKVRNAKSATLLLDAATNFVNYKDVSADPQALVDKRLKTSVEKPYKRILKDHIKDYQALFNRFQIRLGCLKEDSIPTDQRLIAFQKNPSDPALLALYVQYGRYLMIASSRKGTKPATLQGIWNKELHPSWDSKYTVNVNLEMNYWLTNLTNLSACNEPLFSLLQDLHVTGTETAREQYNCDGWVVHHNTDQWRGTAPINASNHGIYLGATGWLSLALWEHYQYTQDITFLRDTAYPILHDAALFYSEFLSKDPKTGYLISTPSNSPEIGGLVAGPTMDHQIIRELFRAYISAASLLKKETAFEDQIKTMIPQIAPNKIGQYGQLQEWMEDKDDPTVKHRHVSHLWGVFPGKDINWDSSPELMQAAMRSLEMRGDDGTGWSLAWKINYWARFLKGDHAYKLIEMIFRPVAFKGVNYTKGGGSYPNLFDAHPPFQIDGNFGASAGILEMFMQSHLDRINLLPALPTLLPEGHLHGLCARGGFVLDFDWNQGCLNNVSVLSTAGNSCTLVYEKKKITFPTEKGKTYTFTVKDFFHKSKIGERR